MLNIAKLVTLKSEVWADYWLTHKAGFTQVECYRNHSQNVTVSCYRGPSKEMLVFICYAEQDGPRTIIARNCPPQVTEMINDLE